MAQSLQRIWSRRRAMRATASPFSRSFSSEALVEVKPGEIGMVSGIPEEHLRRSVVIYSPARTATQHGSGKLGGGRSILCQHKRDPYANVGDAGLSFDNEEAARAFAERHGWKYVVKKHQTPLLKPKLYADNFKWKGPPKLDAN